MKRFFFVLVMIGICSMASASLSDKISMDFRDADIRDICKIIAGRAGMGFVIEKSVRGMLTISVKDVSAKEALDLTTKAAGFAWVQTRGTIFVSDEKKLGREVRVISLKHLSAEETAKILCMTIAADIKIATCNDSNSIVLNGCRESLDNAMQIVGQIDKPGRFIKASLKFVSGEKVLEKFDFTAKAGEAINFEERINLAAGKATLNCDLRIRGLSSNGVLDADIKLVVKIADKKADSETLRKYTGQFLADKGKSCEVLNVSENGELRVLFTWEK